MHKVEAKLSGEEECQVMRILDPYDAKTVFRYFLNQGIRPVRLWAVDDELVEDALLMSAENGIRKGC